jgi:NAD(P)-dependent dehydrogenase (short-subunit alcohol dehydrogenase family)
MKLAVITGAAQGLGLKTARKLAEAGYWVILTGRSDGALSDAARSIGPAADWRVLDVADDLSVGSFFDWLTATHGRIDVLVNNAGRIYGAHRATLAATDAATIAEAIDNNALGAWRMLRRALPMMGANGFGRIVNVSSGMGALNEMGSGAIPYRVSKTALNALTILAAHEAPAGVKVNAVCPGWVRTGMGGPNAPRDVDQGAAGIVWAATLPADGPSGGFFRDGKPIGW